MRTLLWCICYDLSGNNISLEGRHLVLTLLGSIQYSHTFFTSKQINLAKKNKERQKLYDMNVRAICGCWQVGRH